MFLWYVQVEKIVIVNALLSNDRRYGRRAYIEHNNYLDTYAWVVCNWYGSKN